MLPGLLPYPRCLRGVGLRYESVPPPPTCASVAVFGPFPAFVPLPTGKGLLNIPLGPHLALGGVRSAPPTPLMLRSPGAYSNFSISDRCFRALGTGEVAAYPRGVRPERSTGAVRPAKVGDFMGDFLMGDFMGERREGGLGERDARGLRCRMGDFDLGVFGVAAFLLSVCTVCGCAEESDVLSLAMLSASPASTSSSLSLSSSLSSSISIFFARSSSSSYAALSN
mmetsp:Transcript_36886/g.77880  ORF Transcript_36886/g.77880 Transcript_36886/m.77880 type:complete len:225 (-) Transcript_36886:1093-1767(-)